MKTRGEQWREMTPEEKRAYLERQYARKDRTRTGTWKGRKHWTETCTSEELQAWKDKVKAGRDQFWKNRTKGRGRPKKFNYKKGWNPAKKSAASKANWEKWSKTRPEMWQRIMEAWAKSSRKRSESLHIYREEYNWAKEQGAFQQKRQEDKKENETLYEQAKILMSYTGVEPAKNMPPEYYQELIDFFTHQI